MDLHTPQTPTTPCHVVAFPFPGRGHINPMMCLCHSIAAVSPATIVSFIVTEEWLGFIGSYPKPENVQFVTIPQVIPSEIGRGKDSPAFYETVLRKIRAPVEELLDRIEPPVTVLIADTYFVWSVEIGNVRNIPVASLWTMSASVYSMFQYFDLVVEKHHFPVNLAEKGEELVDYIPGLPTTRVADLPTCFYGKGLNVLDTALKSVSCLTKAQHLLLPSVYELEPKVIEALRQTIPIPVYHIGPTIPYFKVEANSRPNSEHYFDWLDNQPRGSVLYVSQGSLHSAPQAQMDEIAAGLKASGKRFFWVAREKVSELTEKCGDMGIVVPWCDQLTVLCHPSLGGFWSHCGWNSTMEAAYAGLPMLTFPIYWDQVPNSKMIVEDWNVGWSVKKGSKDESLVSREKIAGLVKNFMDSENEEGKEMRKRARKNSEICKQAVRKGGSSYNSVNTFISDISKRKQ